MSTRVLCMMGCACPNAQQQYYPRALIGNNVMGDISMDLVLIITRPLVFVSLITECVSLLLHVFFILRCGDTDYIVLFDIFW